MKKIISMILAVVMLACVSTTAFAFDGASGSDVVTHVYSHYNITIPATINVTVDSASRTTTDIRSDNCLVFFFPFIRFSDFFNQFIVFFDFPRTH